MYRLPDNALFMAPMVDLSHEPYRQLIRSFGGCDFFFSEMLNARIVPSESPATSVYLKWSVIDDLIFQILGNDPAKMELAAEKLAGYGPCGIDINMGCWLNKVMVHGWGAALMKDIEKAAAILSVVRRAVKTCPLSVKIRIGERLDKGYLLEFSSMLEEGGSDFITLHARTIPDGMNRQARWEYIGAVKDRLSIPVVGNGDVRRPEDALEMMRRTGCDGVMIGRQALIQPWIFRDVKALMAGSGMEKAPDLEGVLLNLLGLMSGHFPQDVAMKRFRAAVPWLAQNLAFGHHLGKEACRAKDAGQAAGTIRAIFARGIS